MVAVAAFGLAWMHAYAGRLPIATAWTASQMGRGEGGRAPRSLHLALFTPLPDPPASFQIPLPPWGRRGIDAARAGVGASWANTQLTGRINTLQRGAAAAAGSDTAGSTSASQPEGICRRCELKTEVTAKHQPETPQRTCARVTFQPAPWCFSAAKSCDDTASARRLRPGLPGSGSQASRTGCPSVTDPR